MKMFVRVSLAACAGALALVWAQLPSAKAADMQVVPQEQYQGYQAPPPAYGPPPVQQGYAYPPPPAVYGYPPPPVAYYQYAEPAYVVVPGGYYGRGPYFPGYGPRYAYGYGRWGHGGYRHR